MGRHDRDQNRRRNAATSRSLRRLAAARQCKACGRKAAMVSISLPGLPVGKMCRYCKAEVRVS